MLPSEVSEVNLKLLVDLASSAPKGPIVEVGVYKGGSAQRLYEVCEAQQRQLHLFDTFKGMPVYSQGVDHFPIGSFNVNNDTPAQLQLLMPKALLHIGFYPATHPRDLKDIAFIHCDCDQYLSYKSVIVHLWPLVVPGGMMLFDDYPYLAGAKLAVHEAFKESELLPCGEHFYVTKPIARVNAVG